MRPTLIIYAHPDTLALMAENKTRFAGRRHKFAERFYAAWLVFTGRADAISWDY
jgi:hypothetical protein